MNHSTRFLAPNGQEIPAVTASQMAEVDRVAIEKTGPNLFQMMENAGRSLALTALDMLTSDSKGPIVVLAGTGGNGGGGISAARHLANRGIPVSIAFVDPDRLGRVPNLQREIYDLTPGGYVEVKGLDALEPALVIDAVIGYGLKSAPRGIAADMINWSRTQSVATVSLDVPSGIDASTGETPGVHMIADVTLTLALPKTGLWTSAAGSLILADIGIPIETYRLAGIDVPQPLFTDSFRMPLRRAPLSRSPDDEEIG